MAGGKETPRQKMIGMMYLVLTALLALNVSKTILDAFVAIEENIQKSSLTELFRGDERRDEIIETSLDKTNPNKASKAELLKKTIDEIDAMTSKRIRLIDEMKLKILEDCGEDIESVNNDDAIMVEKYDPKGAPLKPIRMNLENVLGKDKYDEVMNIMIGGDIKRPDGDGKKLWESLLSYRKELTEKVAGSQLGVDANTVSFDKKYFFKAPAINKFSSQKDLNDQLTKSIEQSNVHPDDASMILEIYKSLTKEEFSTVNDVNDVHWIGKTFDHAPSVAALASLSSLQKEILAARANALVLIRSRVGGNDYSFNKIFPFAQGPEVVNEGDEFDVGVMMVAYDSDKQPEVTIEGGSIDEVKEGKGIMHLKAAGSEMDLKGTITIQNKAGIKKTMEWTKRIHVMKPSGSIELPELNVLYRGYKNRVNATASGFPETVLTASGASLTRDGVGYIVSPTGTGRKAYLTVSGRTADGRLVQLKRVEYKVSRMPKPNLYVGAATDGQQIPPSGVLNSHYDGRTPLQATFRIVSWECNVPGAQGRPPSGNSSDISRALNLIRAARRGQKISFSAKVKGPDGIVQSVSSTFTK